MIYQLLDCLFGKKSRLKPITYTLCTLQQVYTQVAFTLECGITSTLTKIGNVQSSLASARYLKECNMC